MFNQTANASKARQNNKTQKIQPSGYFPYTLGTQKRPSNLILERLRYLKVVKKGIKGIRKGSFYGQKGIRRY